jgi:hypothetical protein
VIGVLGAHVRDDHRHPADLEAEGLDDLQAEVRDLPTRFVERVERELLRLDIGVGERGEDSPGADEVRRPDEVTARPQADRELLSPRSLVVGAHEARGHDVDAHRLLSLGVEVRAPSEPTRLREGEDRRARGAVKTTEEIGLLVPISPCGGRL